MDLFKKKKKTTTKKHHTGLDNSKMDLTVN